MAKIDAHTSRATALVEDEQLDPFYRPARAASKLRPESSAGTDDFDAQEEESFLRSRKRVAVRRGILPQNRIVRIAYVFGMILGLALLVLAAMAVRDFLKNDPRFRIDNSSAVQIVGNSEVTQSELLAVFGSDIGRNVFFIPLAERRADLERLPWVEHATVMRLLPNQLRVSIVERTPVAFVRHANEIGLVDRNGVVLDMSPSILAARHFSFPVVTGIEAGDPLSMRAARMKIYQRFLSELDGAGEKVSEQLSEVDLTDPEDVKALLPEQGSDILAHFGDEKFLSRYENYKAHLAEWRQQYPHLASVDLRYDHQVVLEMEKGTEMTANQAAETKSADPALSDAKSQAVIAPKAAPHHAAPTARAKTKRVRKPGTGVHHR